MSNAGLGFRATVIAGVLSALLAAVFTWLFGFWPAIWSWIGGTAKWFWNVLWIAIPVPLVVIPIFLIASLALVLRKKSNHPAIGGKDHVPYSSKAVPTGMLGGISSAAFEPRAMSTSELKVLQLLAAADGSELPFDEIARDSSMSRLAAEQTVEHLMSRGYVRERNDVLFGSMISLSASGRDWVLSAGFVRS